MKRILFFLRRDKNNKKKKKEGQSGGLVGEKKKEFGLVNGPHNFQLIYKKTILQHYLKNKNGYGWVFIIHVLNTLDKKNSYQTHFSFLGSRVFSV